jgi:hypothetical protein
VDRFDAPCCANGVAVAPWRARVADGSLQPVDPGQVVLPADPRLPGEQPALNSDF